MCYILQTRFHPSDYSFTFDKERCFYAPVHQYLDWLRPLDEVVFWVQAEGKAEGIYGTGRLLQAPRKVSELLFHRDRVTEDSQLQVLVQTETLIGPYPFIPAPLAYLLPSLNKYKGTPIRLKQHRSVVFGYGLYEEFAFLRKHLNFMDDPSNNPAFAQRFYYALHLLQEHEFGSLQYKRINRQFKHRPMICIRCHTDFEKLLGRKGAEQIMELHEQALYIYETYKEMKPEWLDIICPTCHQMVHLEWRDKLNKN